MNQNPINEQKNLIRKDILEKRNSLKMEQIREYSEAIIKNLLVLDGYSKSKVVMLYASFGSEVDTHALIQNSLLSKKVVLPKVNDGVIIPSLILSYDNLMPDFRGILEPIEALPIKHSTIDSVIVPGIAFDSQGNRLGFGKGNYDRFLKRATHAVKIGLAYDSQMVESIPSQEHDVPMDFVVTPTRILRRG
ncbi:MAG TPA: 5-formyltetrahydrofolate cyclo-ligase [Candidatus Nanoarchaeia archaeon]|nr:5-formyltetrahydrofolate cyclo-ligase [Candidatus Nanoarchaeia archaeon]